MVLSFEIAVRDISKKTKLLKNSGLVFVTNPWISLNSANLKRNEWEGSGSGRKNGGGYDGRRRCRFMLTSLMHRTSCL